jgi:hypothetical protein
MIALNAFGDDKESVAELTGNPVFKLMLKSEEVQGTVRMASVRKML